MGDGHGGARGGGADCAYQGEHVLVFDERGSVQRGGFRFVGVVPGCEFQLAAVDAAGLVAFVEGGLYGQAACRSRVPGAGPLKAADWPKSTAAGLTPGTPASGGLSTIAAGAAVGVEACSPEAISQAKPLAAADSAASNSAINAIAACFGLVVITPYA